MEVTVSFLFLGVISTLLWDFKPGLSELSKSDMKVNQSLLSGAKATLCNKVYRQRLQSCCQIDGPLERAHPLMYINSCRLCTHLRHGFTHVSIVYGRNSVLGFMALTLYETVFAAVLSAFPPALLFLLTQL